MTTVSTSAPVTTRGATIWLTGLPSSGKSTIAHALAGRLLTDGHRVEVLDGDALRQGLTSDLGFSRTDRDANVRRIGYVAALLARHGVKVLVPVIAPYAESRDAVRALHDTDSTPYVEVHVAAPVDVCSQRDVKGLYAKQAAGQLTGLTGVDDPYEVPAKPELRVASHDLSLNESVGLVHAVLAARGLA